MKKYQMRLTPKLLKLALNFYPPYLGAGVKVAYVSEDWKELHVSMSLRWFNRNAVGTHFGGSLYSMVDPHLMLLLMQLLGNDYLVWDKTADIEFVKASKSKVTSIIKVTNDDLEVIKNKTCDGKKYFSNFVVEIRDVKNDLVAIVKKTIYVRKKQLQL
jgi:acyl-coenzyme A thioesterase PaaI-like protein